MANRINRAIELFNEDQPVYYTGCHVGAVLTRAKGREMAKTWADYINIGMEHGSFDLLGLEEFMQGLLDGGPTASGHNTPAVIVELPVVGSSIEAVRANAWQITQVLAKGVHGLVLCHAETPGAVKAFVESCRYPFHRLGLGSKIDEGRRGSAGQDSAAPIWGITPEEYLEVADAWPLNPNGELLLGLKIENKRAVEKLGETLSTPGIAFAEWGPGDMSMSLGYRALPQPLTKELLEIRNKVFNGCRQNEVKFLEHATPEDIQEKISEGVRVFSAVGSLGEETATAGRHYSGRSLPV